MRKNSRKITNYRLQKEKKNLGNKLAEQFITQITLAIIILSIVYAFVILDIKQAIPILDMIKSNINITTAIDEIVESVNIIINDINYKIRDTNNIEEPVILIDNEEV